MDATVAWILAVIAALLVGALIGWALNGRFRSRRLKERFGPEYERVVERTDGDRKRAEAILGDRIFRWEQLELRPLSPAARDAYRRRWEQAQADFVDQPRAVVGRARALLDQVIVERGYPADDSFEERAELVSVDHPEAVERYRIAHRLQQEDSASSDTAASNEERRQALLHYRALFTELLDTAGTAGAAEPEPGTADGAAGRDNDVEPPEQEKSDVVPRI